MSFFRPKQVSHKELYRKVLEKLNQPGSPFVQSTDVESGEVRLTSFQPSDNRKVMAFSLVLGGTEGFTIQWNYTLVPSYRAELGSLLKGHLGQLFDQCPQVW